MLKFDFKTYTKNIIDSSNYEELMSKKEEILNKLSTSSMNGWTKQISKDNIDKIKEVSSYIKENFDCLVMIGIGGSFLGSYAFEKMFKKYYDDNNFEIIYAGTTLSSKKIDELLSYLENKNFCINVVSKSGTTMETTITYTLIKKLLKRKYSEEEVTKRIIVTTDKENGTLREEVNEKKYISFEIPNNIGGRYSFITPAHLLPLSLNYDLTEIIDGYYDGKRFIDYAYEYAVTRKILFDNKKYIENYTVSEENMSYFTEWLKQLFGETEGKNNVGIYPTSTVFTRDLHSLGQFIQEGNKILFETFIKVKKSDNYIEYNKMTLNEINNIVIDSVEKAHYSGNVPVLDIEMDELSIANVTQLIYFFQLAAAFSGYLFGVDPFNQPGVEVYKEEVRKSLNS